LPCRQCPIRGSWQSSGTSRPGWNREAGPVPAPAAQRKPNLDRPARPGHATPASSEPQAETSHPRKAPHRRLGALGRQGGSPLPTVTGAFTVTILRAAVRLPSRVTGRSSVIPARSALCRVGHSASHAPGQQDRDRSRYPTAAARAVLPVPIRALSLGPVIRSGNRWHRHRQVTTAGSLGRPRGCSRSAANRLWSS
jgi:hypothetical protein